MLKTVVTLLLLAFFHEKIFWKQVVKSDLGVKIMVEKNNCRCDGDNELKIISSIKGTDTSYILIPFAIANTGRKYIHKCFVGRNLPYGVCQVFDCKGEEHASIFASPDSLWFKLY